MCEPRDYELIPDQATIWTFMAALCLGAVLADILAHPAGRN